MFKFLFKKRGSLKGMEIEDSIMTATQKEEAVMEFPFARKRLDLIRGIAVFFIVFLIGRVFYLDVVRGGYYSELSKGNRIRSAEIKAPRGKIMDKFGNLLVKNVSSIDAVAIPGDLPENEDEKKRVLDSAAGIIDLSAGEIEEKIRNQNKKSVNPVLLKENISQEQALVLAEKKKSLPGIAIENTAIRNYENSFIFSGIIGYEGKITKGELEKNPEYSLTDYIGKSGLEKYYEKELKGINGARQVEVDAVGNVKKNLGIVSPKNGSDLVLNIDEGLQKKLYDSLSEIISAGDTKTAAAVAIDPRNGGVLAMVSLPSYDNNLFSRGISAADYQAIIKDKNLPLLNRAIAGEYPPGSTIKPAIVAAALSEKTIAADTTVTDSHGAINIGSWRFGDWKTHGVVDARKAIAESCDVFFYALGGGYANIRGLGMNLMKKYLNSFGFGNVSGIDLAGEAAGLIPDEQWKMDQTGEKWYIGDSYHASIGQGFLTATPLQLANYAAAIANGGTLYRPRIVNKIKKNNGEEQYFMPEAVREKIAAGDILQIAREGMRQTITDGTAQQLKSLAVEVAGKTGTAQFGSEGKTHGWFISFAPYDNPEIAMVVLAEGGGEGHSTAVPVTKEVYEWYFSRQ